MTESPSTIVVVPCYEEEERLDVATFLAFSEAHPGIGFLMVDDGSGDGTLRVLEQLAEARSTSFSVLALPENQGKAEAVRQGIRSALEREPLHVGFWDADLATPLEAIPRFVEEFQSDPEVEVVLGSRIRLLGRHIDRNPARHYFGRLAATVVSGMLQLPVYDTQCGAKMFRAGARVHRMFATPFVTRWVFDVELLARWLIDVGEHERPTATRRIVELPLDRWEDVRGSKLGPGDFASAPMELARIWWTYGRHLPGR